MWLYRGPSARREHLRSCSRLIRAIHQSVFVQSITGHAGAVNDLSDGLSSGFCTFARASFDPWAPSDRGARGALGTALDADMQICQEGEKKKILRDSRDFLSLLRPAFRLRMDLSVISVDKNDVRCTERSSIITKKVGSICFSLAHRCRS